PPTPPPFPTRRSSDLQARRDAERIFVGKAKGTHSASQGEINAILVREAKAGRRVVRLKSGDPLIFGRAGEEIEALRAAGVSFDIDRKSTRLNSSHVKI